MDDQRGRQDLYVQAARRRVVLQRQEIHRRGRDLQLQAAEGSRDQGAVCLARRQHQGIARARSLHRRIRTRRAVLRAAAAAHHVHQRDPQQGQRRGARQGLRHQGRRRHRAVVFRSLAAAHRDRAEAPRRLQMGPVDVQEQGPGEIREAGHQDRARGFQPRRGDDGRPVRHHPPVSVAVHRPGQGRPDADGDRGQAELPAALFRLQDDAADGRRQARARGHEHRHQPRRDRQGHPAGQCRSGLSPSSTRMRSTYDPKTKDIVKEDIERAKKLLDEAGWKPGADGVREKDGERAGAESLLHRQRQLGPGGRGDPGLSPEDRRRLAAQPVGLDHLVGQDGRAGL